MIKNVFLLLFFIVVLLIPIAVFFRALRKWWKDGRDPKITKTVIAHYEPPANLSPAILGVLLKEKVDVKDILATVVDLAVRGYIKTREEERKVLFIRNKEYIFEKLKPEILLKSFEKIIIKSLFGDKDSISSAELRNKFYTRIPDIEKEIYKEVAKENLFNGNIQETRKKYSRKQLIGFVYTFIIFFIIPPIFLISGLSLYIFQALIIDFSILISFTIGLIFSHFMPALTQRGLELKWQALGFREYLHAVERFKIGAETLETFSKFLPYAMIFKVEKEWGERFSDFSYQNQSWYIPFNNSSLSNFSSSFSVFSDSISNTFTSSSKRSGYKRSKREYQIK